MPLKLHEVKTDAEFEAIVAVQYEAYAKPYNAFWEVLKGPSQSECTTRLIAWHNSDPTSHWLYVTDEFTGEVIGAGQWNIHETNPFGHETPVLTAYWCEEGDLKTISDQMFAQFFNGRPHRMNRPHLLLNFCFVHSQHRRRGAAKLIMEWGCQKADEMKVEAFVESTEDGRSLYEAHGFVVVDDIDIDADVEQPSEEYKRLKKELLPIHGWFMWRPKGGKFEKGVTKLSWEE